MKKNIVVLAVLTACVFVGIIVGATAVGLMWHQNKTAQPAQPETPANPTVNNNVQSLDSPNLPASNSNSQGITLEQAKAIALNKAGLSEDEVFFEEMSRDFEDGKEIYEIEFKNAGVEYSAEILVSDGTIVSWEVEHDFN